MRATARTGSKDGRSDPVARCGSAIAQRIKGTLGITGLSRPRVHIDGAVWHLDVGLAHPHERRNHEGFDCSSIKELHELGLIRRETVWFLSSRGNWSKIKTAPLYERNWVC